MKQVVAEIISSAQILERLERPGGRNILGSHLLWLHCPEIAREARPGQFVMLRCGDECVLPRPFSIHQVNNQGEVALFFAVWEGGKGTGWIAQRQPGDTVELIGPLGNGFAINPGSHNLLLVAGGIGIAPLRFLAQRAWQQGQAVTLLYGTLNKDRYPEARLPAAIKLVSGTEDGTVGHHGLITDLLPDFVAWADEIFACGPLAMYQAMAQMPALKDKPVQISLEIVMGCGRGLCYGCTIKTKIGLKKVCQDGPVFDMDDILWDELSQW